MRLDSIKLKPRLIGAFLVVAVIAGLIGWRGIAGLNTVNAGQDDLATIHVPAIAALASIRAAQANAVIAERGLINSRMSDPAVRQALYDQTVSAFAEIDSAWKTLEKMEMEPDQEKAWQEFIPRFNEWKQKHERVVELSREKDRMVAQGRSEGSAAISRMDDDIFDAFMEARTPFLAVSQDLKRLSDENVKFTAAADKAFDAQAQATRTAMIILVIIGMLVAVGLGFVISKSVAAPVSELARAADTLALGGTDVAVNAKGKDEIAELMRSMSAMVDNIRSQADAAEKIAAGDLSIEIKQASERDVLAVSMNRVVTTLRSLVSETGVLSKAAIEGRLDARGNSENFQGGYQDIVQGINGTLDAVIGPLNMAAEYVERISDGDIPEKITDEYHGDFNEIKNNINKCIDAVDALIADTGMLAQAAVDGKFETRADASRHGGDYRKIIDGVNKTLDIVVDKAVWYEGILDNIPFPISATDLDMNWTFINKPVEDMLGVKREDIIGQQCSNWNAGICKTENCGVVKLRSGELQTLFEQMGKQFQVDSAYIRNAKGENVGHVEIVQDITGAGSVAAFQRIEIDRLAKNLGLLADGELSFDMEVSEGNEYTKQVHDNFVEVNDSLAKVKDAVGELISDANMLAESAIEGRLDTRADATKHGGDFRKIIDGVNATLDSIVGNLEAIPTPIQFMDKDFKIQYINRTGADLLGKSKQECTEFKCSDLWNTSKCRTSDCPCQVAMDNDSVFECENDTMLSSGRADIHCAASPLRDQTGEIVGSFEFVIDQSEVKQAARKQDKIAQFQVNEIENLVANLGRFSQGDLDFEIEVSEGDADTAVVRESFLILGEALGNSADAVRGLIADANMLTQAAAEGKLDIRADASKHGGEYAKIIQGFNDTLDAVIGPLSNAAQYMDRISNGDIPEQITDEAQGDFNEIRNSLNRCIGAIDAMRLDVRDLSVSAQEGRLDVRADSDKHNGAFARIVQGFNDTLDAAIKPVNEAANVLEKLAENDLTARMVGEYKGDHAKIKESLNTALDSLEALIVQATEAAVSVAMTAKDVASTAQEVGKASQAVAETINQVAAGSQEQTKMVTSASVSMEQLSQAIEEVSNGAQSQAKTVEDTVSLVQQITMAIDTVAKTAQAAAGASLDVANVAKSGGDSVGKSVQGMARIKETSANVAAAVVQLGENSKQIGAIVETIDDIAEQTNLLALNAAIEAARAGEHGKGFAVVADEVRKLAERSSLATKEIADLIGKIQTMTEHAVEAMQAGTTEVEQGTDLANQAGQALSSILEAVNSIVRQIEDVSAATEEMSASSAEVARAVESLSAVTEESTAATEQMAASASEVTRSVEQVAAVSEENAASAEEVSAAAQEQNASVEEMSASAVEVTRIADDLQTVVSKFKVDKMRSAGQGVRLEDSGADPSAGHDERRAA